MVLCLRYFDECGRRRLSKLLMAASLLLCVLWYDILYISYCIGAAISGGFDIYKQYRYEYSLFNAATTALSTIGFVKSSPIVLTLFACFAALFTAFSVKMFYDSSFRRTRWKDIWYKIYVEATLIVIVLAFIGIVMILVLQLNQKKKALDLGMDASMDKSIEIQAKKNKSQSPKDIGQTLKGLHRIQDTYQCCGRNDWKDYRFNRCPSTAEDGSGVRIEQLSAEQRKFLTESPTSGFIDHAFYGHFGFLNNATTHICCKELKGSSPDLKHAQPKSRRKRAVSKDLNLDFSKHPSTEEKKLKIPCLIGVPEQTLRFLRSEKAEAKLYRSQVIKQSFPSITIGYQVPVSCCEMRSTKDCTDGHSRKLPTFVSTEWFAQKLPKHTGFFNKSCSAAVVEARKTSFVLLLSAFVAIFLLQLVVYVLSSLLTTSIMSASWMDDQDGPSPGWITFLPWRLSEDEQGMLAAEEAAKHQELNDVEAQLQHERDALVKLTNEQAHKHQPAGAFVATTEITTAEKSYLESEESPEISSASSSDFETEQTTTDEEDEESEEEEEQIPKLEQQPCTSAMAMAQARSRPKKKPETLGKRSRPVLWRPSGRPTKKQVQKKKVVKAMQGKKSQTGRQQQSGEGRGILGGILGSRQRAGVGHGIRIDKKIKIQEKKLRQARLKIQKGKRLRRKLKQPRIRKPKMSQMMSGVGRRRNR